MDTIAGTGPRILIIEAPPRHGKSELVSRYLPAWYLGTFPNRRVILTSYAADYARTWGRKSREVLTESQQMFGVRVSDAQSAAVDWEIAGTGGGMVTAGSGGPITGRGAHLFIFDDTVKNAEEALSETVRESQWDWWLSTASTRLEPGACVVGISTRWHKEDLCGRLQAAAANGEGDPVRVLRLPAIAEEGDLLGRKPGEPLWPERWPLHRLEQKRLALGSFWWNALYQQRPTQHGDAEFKDHLFGPQIYPAQWPSAFEGTVISIDPSKGKDAKSGDYAAIVATGLANGKIFVDAELERMPAARIVGAAIEMALKYKPLAVGVEVNQFQELLLPEFARQCEERHIAPLPLIPIENTVNKQLRIRRLGAYLERDEFRFKADTKGTRLMVQQLREFPLADHDDGPDALEMGIRTWQTLGGVVSSDVEEIVQA